jgi:disulfide oxidoreductase YuzD
MVEKVPLGGSRKLVATWEHIINDASIITRKNIARCCASCNSSKGTKKLTDWLESNYCKKKNINENTVAPIVKNALNTKHN